VSKDLKKNTNTEVEVLKERREIEDKLTRASAEAEYNRDLIKSSSGMVSKHKRRVQVYASKFAKAQKAGNEKKAKKYMAEVQVYKNEMEIHEKYVQRGHTELRQCLSEIEKLKKSLAGIKKKLAVVEEHHKKLQIELGEAQRAEAIKSLK
jgi:phage shock protein A